MRLHHVAIAVEDMERSLAFYRDALGLSVFQDEIISGPDVDRGLMETGARVRMVLLADEAGNMIELLGWLFPPLKDRPAEDRRFTSRGLVEVALMVSDLSKVEDDLKKKGFSFRTPVWRFGSDLAAYGGAEAWMRYVEDPDGVQVELMQVVAPEPE
jgi:catechol 2,3-dioxygenase-like lactoylglutathione lyase family enzyme